MFSTKYSVSDIANMLIVNEETVRRWIRDGKLKANSAKGRGGSTIYIKDIIDFVNKPPREYLLPLEIWLTDNNIPYKTVEVNEETDDKNKTKAIATGGAITAATASMAIPVAGPVVAGLVASTVVAHSLAKKKKNKSYPNYIIVLLDSIDVEKANESEETNEKDAVEVDFTAVSDNQKEENATVSATEPNETQNISEEAQSAASILTEISRAKQMVDMGIITEEEFAEIKIKLIAKL